MAADAAHELSVYYLYQMTAVRAYVAAFDSAFVIGAVVILAGIIPALFLYDNASKKAKTGHPTVPME